MMNCKVEHNNNYMLGVVHVVRFLGLKWIYAWFLCLLIADCEIQNPIFNILCFHFCCWQMHCHKGVLSLFLDIAWFLERVVSMQVFFEKEQNMNKNR